MRPTLLRVLTDLYLQRPTHTPEDERYYTELALRLIDATDASARTVLAARLAPYPSAPRAVIERLARDMIEVAGPILEHSPVSPLPTCGHRRGSRRRSCGDHQARPPAAPPAMRATTPIEELATAEASELSELFYAAGRRSAG